MTFLYTGTFTVPAGTTILINVEQIHHDPQYYSDPFKFNPDNFSRTAVGSRPPLAFTPFSSGPRNCLGEFPLGLLMNVAGESKYMDKRASY